MTEQGEPLEGLDDDGTHEQQNTLCTECGKEEAIDESGLCWKCADLISADESYLEKCRRERREYR